MIFAAVLLIIALYLFFLWPSKPSAVQKEKIQGYNYAHRGLQTSDKSIPENSLSAFRAAQEAGYGVEFDVHITADDKLVVFHDNNLMRVCGVDAVIEDLTAEDLKAFRLCGTDESIPTFDEVLRLIDGKIPLIIELKRGQTGKNKLLCRLVSERLSSYPGVYCIESFDPFIVAWFKKHNPQVIRGQLLMRGADYKGLLNGLLGYVLSFGLMNFIARPNFIAHRKGQRSLAVKLCERLGAMRVVWTLHEDDNVAQMERECDAVIFEFYKPGVLLKK